MGIGELGIGKLGIGNWELGIGKNNYPCIRDFGVVLLIIGNCVKSGYTIIAKLENHLAAAGIAFLHCIILAI